MTDRELLEAAAKAAGMSGTAVEYDDRLVFLEDGKSASIEWNPLTDDGDALRLAVKLNMDIQFLPDAVRCRVPGGDWIGETCLPCDTEHLGKAHRLAIVRVAATSDGNQK